MYDISTLYIAILLHIPCNLEFTLLVLENIKIPKYVSWANTVRSKRKMAWIDRLDTPDA